MNVEDDVKKQNREKNTECSVSSTGNVRPIQ